jgi:hypothetical protein
MVLLWPILANTLMMAFRSNKPGLEEKIARISRISSIISLTIKRVPSDTTWENLAISSTSP